MLALEDRACSVEVAVPDFDALHSPIGRESIPPERLMRALLLQAFYSIRSERQLVERIAEAELSCPVLCGTSAHQHRWSQHGYRSGGARRANCESLLRPRPGGSPEPSFGRKLLGLAEASRSVSLAHRG
jgi:hypothetical protein